MNHLRINEMLSLIFLFIALGLRPVYKYFEYVLDFPRVNITSIYIVLFLLFIFSNIYNYKNHENEKSFTGLSTFLVIINGFFNSVVFFSIYTELFKCRHIHIPNYNISNNNTILAILDSRNEYCKGMGK